MAVDEEIKIHLQVGRIQQANQNGEWREGEREA
jgi:hypothetical protein